MKTGLWNRRRQILETGEALEERRFKVGELVEYWGGAMVRGTGLIAGNRHGRSQIMGEVFMGLRWWQIQEAS